LSAEGRVALAINRQGHPARRAQFNLRSEQRLATPTYIAGGALRLGDNCQYIPNACMCAK